MKKPNEYDFFEQVDDKKLYEQEKVFKSYAQMVAVMTEEERTTPELLAKSAGRRRRVAQESETSETEVRCVPLTVPRAHLTLGNRL